MPNTKKAPAAQAAPTDDPMLTAAEMARWLGVHRATVSRNTRRKPGQPGIPAVQVGTRKWRYRKSEVEAWMARGGRVGAG